MSGASDSPLHVPGPAPLSHLQGLRVVAVGRGLAPPTAAVALADLGADVVRLVAPDSGPREPLQEVLLRGQRLQQVDLDSPSGRECARRWAGAADLVVGDESLARAGLDRASLTSTNPRLVELRFDGFSSGSAWDGLPPLDPALSAASGLSAVPGGLGFGYSPLPLPSVVGALQGLTGALAALIAARRDGLGERVRVTLADSAVALQELGQLLLQSEQFGNGLRWAASPWVGAHRAADRRWLFVHAGLRRHAERLIEVVGRQDGRAAERLRLSLARDHDRGEPLLPSSPAAARRLRAVLAAALRRRTASEWESALGQAGVAAAKVRSTAEWFRDAEARAAGAVCSVPEAEHAWLQPAPWIAESASAPVSAARAHEPRWLPRTRGHLRRAADSRPALSGLRIVDLSRIIAGPVASRTLAHYGAEVLKCEDPSFDPPFQAAFRFLYDRGKRLEHYNLKSATERAKFWQRLEKLDPDAVVHNLLPAAAERLGLDGASLARRLPRTCLVTVSGYGHRPPLAGLPAWEQTIQAATGIQLREGQGGPPRLLPVAANDIATGLAASCALLASVWRRQQGHAPVPVNAALCRTALWLQLPWAYQGAQAQAPKEPRFSKQGGRLVPRFYPGRGGPLMLAGPPGQLRLLASTPGLEKLGRRPGRRALARALRQGSARSWGQVLRQSPAGRAFAIVPARRASSSALRADRRRRDAVQRETYPTGWSFDHAGPPARLGRTGHQPLGPGALSDRSPPAKRWRLPWSLPGRRGAKLQLRAQQLRFLRAARRNSG